jgi:malate synthase
VRSIIEEVASRLEGKPGDKAQLARRVFEEVAIGEEFVEFLTLPAYEHIS